MTSTVVPARITEARESRAVSMEDLAENIGVTRQSVSKYERGIVSPSQEMLQSMAFYLQFPVSFFYKKETTDSAERSALFFRSNSGVSKKVKTACKYQVKWTDDVKQHLELYVDFTDVNFQAIDSDCNELTSADIENIALEIRRNWNIKDDPVVDLIGLLENNGVIVAQFTHSKYCDFKGVEAYSCWKNGTPYIMYNSVSKSAVRTRFSICHELGHLIMHSAISKQDAVKKEIVDAADRQADLFAAAFLLPATSFPKDIRSTSVASLEPVKIKWGAAMSTIIKRCETLDILTENQLNYLKRQMTIKKYWYKEPLDDVLKVESPEILNSALSLLIENRLVTKQSFAQEIGVGARDLSAILSVPDDYFDGYIERTKPALRVI